VRDHNRLFRNLYRALRPGGWLIAQCGGGRNLARLLARVDRLMTSPAYAKFFAGYPFPWEFSDADTAADRLRQAGFEQVEASLEEAPTQLPSAPEYQQFVESVILRNHLLQIPDAAPRQQFLAELTKQAAADEPSFILDYWRLNLQGRRG
jgi:trans-aconitate 2-methyltransferase